MDIPVELKYTESHEWFAPVRMAFGLSGLPIMPKMYSAALFQLNCRNQVRRLDVKLRSR